MRLYRTNEAGTVMTKHSALSDAGKVPRGKSINLTELE